MPDPGNFVSWEDFSKAQIFTWLTNLAGYEVRAEISPVPEIRDKTFNSSLTNEIYQAVYELIDRAEFYQADQLRIRSTDSAVTISYEDDRFDFAVELSVSTIRVVRSGSTFRDFHIWFAAFNREMPTLFMRVLDILKLRTNRPVIVLSSRHRFTFVLYDLKSIGQAPKELRNTHVLRKLIKGIPDDSGKLTESDDALSSAGRIDVTISRWRRMRDQWRLERYDVQGPANKEGQGVWFYLSYIGETYSDPNTQQRVAFKSNEFFTEGDVAYAEFLRDRAISTFMTTLLAGVSFQSASSEALP